MPEPAADHRTGKPPEPRPPADYTRRVMIAAGISALIFVGLLLLWYVAQVLLLAFGGVLLGILLWMLADIVRRYCRVTHGWALAIVVTALVASLAALFYIAGATLVDQFDELAAELPESLERLGNRLSHYRWAQELLDLPPPQDQPRTAGTSDDVGGTTTQPATTQTMVDKVVEATTAPVAETAPRLVRSMMRGIVSFIVVTVVAVYVAATPASYVRGLLRLVPKGKRQRGAEVLGAIGYTLRWWLIGQGVTMVVIGVLTAAGLWLIGIELWLLFGVLAALFNFIPNFGPLISFVPAILLASTGGTGKVAAVTALYLIAQSFEGYVLTPLVQRRAVSLPPAILIVAQVLMGVLAGPLGVMLAAPLTAAGLVVVKMLYVEDALGDEVDTPDDHMKMSPPPAPPAPSTTPTPPPRAE